MRVTKIIDEDFNNYRKPAMFIGTIQCGGKCCIEAGIPLCVCHNDQWRNSNIQNIDNIDIIKKYMNNKLTNAIVFGGLEPFEQFDEMKSLVNEFRKVTNDDIVIYTGYNNDEVKDMVNELKEYSNIIIKFGRYLPDDESRFDEVLGVTLASHNQYGEKVS